MVSFLGKAVSLSRLLLSTSSMGFTVQKQNSDLSEQSFFFFVLILNTTVIILIWKKGLVQLGSNEHGIHGTVKQLEYDS